jgi:hypothetical protein
LVTPGDTTDRKKLDQLITVLDLLQTVPCGTPTLGALIHDVLAGPVFNGRDGPGLADQTSWSEDLSALVRLVPPDHNFSLGERDGVLWAWIQPNDTWVPGPYEMRHDHPRGSGLKVACTLPLALAAALVALRALTPDLVAATGLHSPQGAGETGPG